MENGNWKMKIGNWELGIGNLSSELLLIQDS